MVTQFGTQEPVLHRGKWINFFAKDRHMFMVNIGPFDSFEPEIFDENALLNINPEQ
jgi:hypothetical protein